MKAAIYARVSTEDQHCEMQLTELSGYAERMGWPAVPYVEKASGKAGSRRPVLDQLLADARLRKFDVVLCWKLDRFGPIPGAYYPEHSDSGCRGNPLPRAKPRHRHR